MVTTVNTLYIPMTTAMCSVYLLLALAATRDINVNDRIILYGAATANIFINDAGTLPLNSKCDIKVTLHVFLFSKSWIQ